MHYTCWYNACIWVAESNTRDSSALLPGAQFQPHQNDAAGTLASRPQGKRLAHTAPKATAASGKLPARSCLRHPWTCQQHGSAVPSKDKGWSSVLMQRHQGQLLLATWMRAYWLDRASCWSTNRSTTLQLGHKHVQGSTLEPSPDVTRHCSTDRDGHALPGMDSPELRLPNQLCHHGKFVDQVVGLSAPNCLSVNKGRAMLQAGLPVACLLLYFIPAYMHCSTRIQLRSFRCATKKASTAGICVKHLLHRQSVHFVQNHMHLRGQPGLGIRTAWQLVKVPVEAVLMACLQSLIDTLEYLRHTSTYLGSRVAGAWKAILWLIGVHVIQNVSMPRLCHITAQGISQGLTNHLCLALVAKLIYELLGLPSSRHRQQHS